MSVETVIAIIGLYLAVEGARTAWMFSMFRSVVAIKLQLEDEVRGTVSHTVRRHSDQIREHQTEIWAVKEMLGVAELDSTSLEEIGSLVRKLSVIVKKHRKNT